MVYFPFCLKYAHAKRPDFCIDACNFTAMSGCFNDIVGDTIAEGDMTDSTSNNESNGMFSVSGMVDENTGNSDRM